MTAYPDQSTASPHLAIPDVTESFHRDHNVIQPRAIVSKPGSYFGVRGERVEGRRTLHLIPTCEGASLSRVEMSECIDQRIQFQKL